MSRVAEALDPASYGNQMDLFGAKPAARYPNAPGHCGVPTSVAAAASMAPLTGPLHRKIVEFLTLRGARGATYSEIMEGCGLGAPTVCGRMVELREAKRVVVSAETRPTPSGRKAHVYKIAGLP